MLYREIIAVCSQIHTKHINTLCGQNVTRALHTISTGISPTSTRVQIITHVTHDFSYSFNVPACRKIRIFLHGLYGRKLIRCQLEERRRDIMTFHRRVKKAKIHVKVVVAREMQINRRDEWGCRLEHRTLRYCRQNFNLAAINTGLESRPSIKTNRMQK